MGHQLFISYAIKDNKLFNVPMLAARLEADPGIDRVYYCEADAQANVVQYMDEYLANSDGMLLLCTPTSNTSDFVKLEYQNAVAMRKPIVPVFVQQDHIPTLVRAAGR